MKNIISYFLFIFVIVGLYGFAFVIGQDSEPVGKKVFLESKCTVCHSVDSENISSGKKNAVDLSKVGDNLSSEFLQNYLIKNETINGKKHKISFKGSKEELQSISNWLVKTQKEKAK